MASRQDALAQKKSLLIFRLFRSGAVFCFVLTVLFFAARQMPLTWDEGDAFDRTDLVRQWFSLIRSAASEPLSVFDKQSGSVKSATDSANPIFSITSASDSANPTAESLKAFSPFSQETIKKYWEHTIYREGHPAGYTILNAVGKTVFDATGSLLGLQYDNNSFYSPKLSYRFGVLFLFALALSCVYCRLEKTYDKKTAVLSVLAILLLPRVFGHSVLAVCDSPLMSAWLLTWSLFDSARKSKRGAVVWGILLGLGLSVKFPGWIIPVPFLIWLAWFYRKKPWDLEVRRIVLLGFPLALLTFYLLNPPIWSDPIAGFSTFIRLNTHRIEHFNIPIYLFGKVYAIDRPLPWYNGFLWTVMTVPPGLLLFSLFAGWNQRTFLIFLNYFVLMLVRMIPGIPVHDGVRLFVAAFPFLAILAGIGAARMLNGSLFFLKKTPELLSDSRSIKTGESKFISDCVSSVLENRPADLGKRSCSTKNRWKKHLNGWYKIKKAGQGLILVIVYGSCALNLFIYAPQWLSYFSALVGGPEKMAVGETEITYYWDSLDDQAIRKINEIYQRPEMKNKKVLFSSFSPKTLRRYNDWKILVPRAETTGSGQKDLSEFGLYIVQNRLSGLSEFDRVLLQEGKPFALKYLRVRRSFFQKDPDQTALLYFFNAAEAGRVYQKTYRNNLDSDRTEK